MDTRPSVARGFFCPKRTMNRASTWAQSRKRGQVDILKVDIDDLNSRGRQARVLPERQKGRDQGWERVKLSKQQISLDPPRTDLHGISKRDIHALVSFCSL